MKKGWRTRAIGRHIVELPSDAKTIESYSYNEDPLEPLQGVSTQASFDRLVAQREQALRATRHATRGSMFIERVPHANGSVTLVSWNRPTGDILYHFDTYFRVGSRAVNYSGDVDPDKKSATLASCDRLSKEWRELPSSDIPSGVGYVVNDVILTANRFNLESWRMVIQLAGKPDASFNITAYTQRKVEPGLRERAGGVLAGLMGAVAGVTQLRNRERPVGPIQADEILVAGTQDGKRTYGFKWEAPGKADSLVEPNLNVSLQVGESAYVTNKESFFSDEEALELWDAVVGSLRLRPGAV
ncbi:T6SS immunity protein Tli4 family protein [Cupriavidus necator]